MFDYAAGACRHDVESLPATPGPWIRAPNAGSITAALIVAAALLVVFAVRDHVAGRSDVAG